MKKIKKAITLATILLNFANFASANDSLKYSIDCSVNKNSQGEYKQFCKASDGFDFTSSLDEECNPINLKFNNGIFYDYKNREIKMPIDEFTNFDIESIKEQKKKVYSQLIDKFDLMEKYLREGKKLEYFQLKKSIGTLERIGKKLEMEENNYQIRKRIVQRYKNNSELLSDDLKIDCLMSRYPTD